MWGRAGTIPIMAYTGRLRQKGVPLSGFGYIGVTLVEVSSSETQEQSVGSGEKARRKVLSTGGLFHPCLEKTSETSDVIALQIKPIRDQVATSPKKKYLCVCVSHYRSNDRCYM